MCWWQMYGREEEEVNGKGGEGKGEERVEGERRAVIWVQL